MYGLMLMPVWMKNHTPNKVKYEITELFPKLNGHTVEVCCGKSNSIPSLQGTGVHLWILTCVARDYDTRWQLLI